MNKTLIFTICLVLTGCASWFQTKQRDGVIVVEDRYRQQAEQCRDAARRLITSCGVNLPDKPPYCHIDVQDGNLCYMVNGQRVWYLLEYGVCGGYSQGRYIKIARDPMTGNITPWVLTHEWGHHWLTSVGIQGHDIRFRGVFKLWYDL